MLYATYPFLVSFLNVSLSMKLCTAILIILKICFNLLKILEERSYYPLAHLLMFVIGFARLIMHKHGRFVKDNKVRIFANDKNL